ncbi:hypothetical protein BDR03DRAFT_963359 [Suillus americanus]|nr:hypothetical protein BDR03DRAFT_963359 [Suillus americanus]
MMYFDYIQGLKAFEITLTRCLRRSWCAELIYSSSFLIQYSSSAVSNIVASTDEGAGMSTIAFQERGRVSTGDGV